MLQPAPVSHLPACTCGGGDAFAASLIAVVRRSTSGLERREELRELFHLDLSTTCSTADLLKGTTGFCEVTASLSDGPLRSLLGDGRVSFVHLSPQNADDCLSTGDESSPPTGEETDRGNASMASQTSLSPYMLGGASQLSLGSPC